MTAASMPERLAVNAWRVEPLVGSPGEGALAWTLSSDTRAGRRLLAPPPSVPLTDWRHPAVGWGLVLPEKYLSSDPIRQLLKARGDAPVFRYLGESQERRLDALLRDSTGKLVPIEGTPPGIADDCLPQYLLIYGSPDEIPWSLQYILAQNRFVGRLDLDGEPLANYVNHLIHEWPDSAARFDAPLVWAVDYSRDSGDKNDITTLMRSAVAERVYEKLRQDEETKGGVRFVDGSVESASGAALLEGLAGHPGLIVTTSHGLIGASETLGLPVDQLQRVVPLDGLVAAWEPDGAIWYAHACCSAGSDARSTFDGLFDPKEGLAKELAGVAALGSQVAPLPKRLLGAAKPLRAFIGHVEPTFDWTLKDPKGTGALRSLPLVSAIYQHLYSREPLAFGFRDWWGTVGSLKTSKQLKETAFNQGEDVEGDLLFYELAARDVQTLVILGDPTVAIPKGH